MQHHSRFMADISSNNSEPDISFYAAAGHIAIGIKATEGEHFVNPFHRGWSLRAGLHHLSIWHYHFARPDLNDSPTVEAAFFLEVVGRLAGPRDFLVCDFERAIPGHVTRDPAWTREFDSFIQARSRFHTVLYANRSTLQQSNAWLVGDRKRVWEADFSTFPDFVPTGYRLAARQFTDGIFGPDPHSLPGIGRCDVSRLSPAMFEQLTHARR